MPVKPCNPPCHSYRCYGCNAAARDLGLAAKAAHKRMADLPEWAQARIRRMIQQTRTAQNTSQALSDAHESGMAQRSYADAMRASDTDWRCAGCGLVQGIDIPKHVHGQRRYCPMCALPFQNQDAQRTQEAAHAKAVQEAIAKGNPLQEIFDKGKAAWTADERIALVSAKMICVHCGKRIGVPDSPRSGPVEKHCYACYMAREYGEKAAAATAKKSAEGIANVAATLAQNDPSKAAPNAGSMGDRFTLLDLDDGPTEEVEKIEEKYNRPIELD